MITEYEVGQKPGEPLTITVYNDAGSRVNLSTYSNVKVEVLGSDNEAIDLTGATLYTQNMRDGIVAVVWPKDRSLFTKSGDYVLRLALYGTDGALDYTRAGTIRVHKFGGKN